MSERKTGLRMLFATAAVAGALAGCGGTKIENGNTYKTDKNTNCLSCPMDEDPNRLQMAFGCPTQSNSGVVPEGSIVTAEEGELGVARNGYVRVKVPKVILWNPTTSSAVTSDKPEICWIPAQALDKTEQK